MKTIVVPKDLAFENLETGEPVLLPDGKPDLMSFRKFAFTFWLNAEEGNTGPVQLERWIGVITKFRSIKKPGEKIVLEDEDHKTLLAIATRVHSKVPPFLAIQSKPFFDAVVNAEKADTSAHLPKGPKKAK